MLKQFLQKQLAKKGYSLVKRSDQDRWPADFEDMHKRIIAKARPFTMTSRERLFGLIEAVKYICHNHIDGDIVECGVWKGGSMLAIAETLIACNNKERGLHLYDTFEGMPAPGVLDVSYDNQKAEKLLRSDTDKERNLVWAYSPLDSVKETMALSAYPASYIKYVKGKVEDTVPQSLPKKIALLRLDTDWYESTRHELLHMFPLLVKGGVLIIDDYGFWKGARKAVDEYISENKITILLNRLDDTGRIAIKQ